VDGASGLPHGTTGRVKGEITPFRIVGGPTNGFVRMHTQRADTEVRAPVTIDLEYGAVRRFSFLRPRRGCLGRDVQPEKSVYLAGWWKSFLCGEPGSEVGGRSPRIQNGGRTVL
jgi:hypothetical protein